MISKDLLGCSTARNKGTCQNRFTIRRDVLEVSVLAGLRTHLMDPGLFAEFCEEFILVGAVPPIMVKSEKNPGGTPIEVFDGFRTALAANRAQFFLDVPSGPFYGFNRPGATVSQGIIQNWWRQGMMGGAKAHYDCIKAFSETDQTDDLKQIDVPTLVMHGDDDQVVPIADAGLLSVKLLKHGTLKVYKGYPHGMLTTHADVLNPDLLAFVQS
jgi:non-heme chloroperoxidase